MAIKITGIRLEGGAGHEHIVRLWWIEDGQYAENNDTKAQVVAWIESGVKAYVQTGPTDKVPVGVVTPAHGEKYLRTYADRVWTNNLLALPKR